VDVTVPPGGRSDRAGIRIHRSRTLLPSPGVRTPTTLRLNIPVTTPTRTLADLERCVPAQHLARAHRQAEVLGLPLEEASTASAAPHTELERRFLALCRRHRLPEPEVNVPVGAYLPDFLWRDARLIAETDGYAFHSGRANFEHDRRRAAALAAAGYELLRFTWWQVTAEPDEVAAALRVRLGARTTPTPESARPA
jgi:very-short-patch-repair endonuclease